jgi:hypothetical protein
MSRPVNKPKENSNEVDETTNEEAKIEPVNLSKNKLICILTPNASGTVVVEFLNPNHVNGSVCPKNGRTIYTFEKDEEHDVLVCDIPDEKHRKHLLKNAEGYAPLNRQVLNRISLSKIDDEDDDEFNISKLDAHLYKKPTLADIINQSPDDVVSTNDGAMDLRDPILESGSKLQSLKL